MPFFHRLAPQQRGLIILGSLACSVAVALSLFFNSPIGLEQFFPLGIIAGLGWIVGGLVVRRRWLLVTVYAVFTVVEIVALLPLLMLFWFQLDPMRGAHFVIYAHRVEDERFDLLVAPNAWGHDAKGFRNPRVPKQADIVAIGDSQTWGYNVSREESWPAVLATLTGQDVYNMSMIQFGTADYWFLVQDALAEFAPKHIIVAFYFGNDLYDTYEAVYLSDAHEQRRMANPPPDLFNDTIKMAAGEIAFKAQGSYSAGDLSTDFTPDYRALALDTDDIRITEGLRITRLMLVEMHANAKAKNVQLTVLLVPTKEMIYAHLADETRTPELARLITLEQQVRDDIIGVLEANHVDYLDALPAMRNALEAGEEIYPDSTDGHPTAAGYRVLARAVADHLAR